ncbi:MAG: ribose-5-phosphate isomerase RpiA [Ignavibacteria bacterium]|nr:ribose-5-phosphate isomerase RpiA [Ignavibacteria bacterium]
MDIKLLKQQAAEKAVEFVKPGMVVGLGTGSTAIFAIYKIGQLLKDGKLKNIIGVPTSIASDNEARKLGIPLAGLDEQPVIDITIDGADEVDDYLNLIKGGGGAHLREKVVAQASKKLIIVCDDSKISHKLGEKFYVPVEVIPFAEKPVKDYLLKLGAQVTVRKRADGSTFISDEQNLILDATFGIIENPFELSAKLKEKAGIVEHGLFTGLTSMVIVASTEGIKTLGKY